MHLYTLCTALILYTTHNNDSVLLQCTGQKEAGTTRETAAAAEEPTRRVLELSDTH
jgi:hypothetical protein